MLGWKPEQKEQHQTIKGDTNMGYFDHPTYDEFKELRERVKRLEDALFPRPKGPSQYDAGAQRKKPAKSRKPPNPYDAGAKRGNR
jgi:hypothetical protein